MHYLTFQIFLEYVSLINLYTYVYVPKGLLVMTIPITAPCCTAQCNFQILQILEKTDEHNSWMHNHS